MFALWISCVIVVFSVIAGWYTGCAAVSPRLLG
jgi:hypothetical protein